MGRLIDADLLAKDTRDIGYIYELIFEIFETVIEEQPTAFDVEKVVEELENHTEINVKDMWESGYNFGIKKAIEIVKGGLNE